MKKTIIPKINAAVLAGILCTCPFTAVSSTPAIIPPFTASAAVYTDVPAGYTGIYSADDLNNIRNGMKGSYILMNDIDLSGIDWIPIGDINKAFRGNFDGNGYAIKNMHISGTMNTNTVGLFGECAVSAVITRLALIDCNIDVTIPESIGASNNYIYIAGITGYNGNVSKCYVTGNIKADIYCSSNNNTYTIGGLCGLATITNSFNNASFDININNDGSSKNNFDIGGVAGYSSNITQCYSTGSINITGRSAPTYYIGSVCGYSSNSLKLFGNNYYLNSASNFSSSGNYADSYFGQNFGLSDDQMKSQSSFGFDFGETWDINPGASYGYPTLKEVPYAGNGGSITPIPEETTTEPETTTTETTTTTEATTTTTEATTTTTQATTTTTQATTTTTQPTTTTTQPTTTTTQATTTTTQPTTTTTQATTTTTQATTTTTQPTTTTTQATTTTTQATTTTTQPTTTTTQPTTTTTTTTSTKPETTTTTTTTTTSTTTTTTTTTTSTTTTTTTTSTKPETTTTTMISTTPETTTTTESTEIVKNIDARADVNNDEIVNANDAAVVLMYVTQVNAGIPFDQIPERVRNAQEKADVNQDTFINAKDAATILRYVTANAMDLNPRLEDFF